MKILEKALLALNLFIWIVVIAILFDSKVKYGWAGIISAIGFLVLFFNARYFIISKLKKFIDSDWQVFNTKMKWANGLGMIILVVLIIIFDLIFE